MSDLLTAFAVHLANWLAANLPALDSNWWEVNVVQRLTFQQQRNVRDRHITSLAGLDLAGLLRVLDQNWHELAANVPLPKEARNWVKEMYSVRNRWAHAPSEGLPAEDQYRDADTLLRLLQALHAPSPVLADVETLRAKAISAVSKKTPPTAAPAPPQPSGPVSAFAVGQIVCLRSDPTAVFPVIEVVVTPGNETRYRVFHSGARQTYYEGQLAPTTAVEEQARVLTHAELSALLTSIQLSSPLASSVYSLNSGRIRFVPYQYRPVLKMISADRPRLLIADEVGVGKTIEAGLILKELNARADVSSVLILCPKPLVSERKWELEMRRFDEYFVPLDGRLLRHCVNETHLEGQWPTQYQKAIVPFSLIDADLLTGRANPGRARDIGLLELDPPPRFDLVIVDEAHHIRNTETYLHQAVRYFCDQAEAVIFLSATPVQLGRSDLFTLLNALRPDLIIDHASFAQMAEPNAFTNQAIQACRLGRTGWRDDVRQHLRQAADTEWGRNVLSVNPGFQHIYDALLDEAQDGPAARLHVMRSLEELYTFSSIINRTRRRDIGEFTTRKPETIRTEFTPEQRELHDSLLQVIAHTLARRHGTQNLRFMMTTVSRQAASCLYGLGPFLEDMLSGRLDELELIEAADQEGELPGAGALDALKEEIRRLINLSKALPPNDPKAEAFVRLIADKQRLTNNKVLVFSTFRHTLAYLMSKLGGQAVRYGVVHGGVADEERVELRRRFGMRREEPEALDVLLSSEVGCEGLDFQYCDCLINYDLPWNPMRIEQRIGRIDRYGQKSDAIAIFNLITTDTIDEAIYDRCLMRIGVFHHAVGGSEEILGEVTREIHEISESFTLTEAEKAARLQQLADNRVRDIEEERKLEERQGELFGLDLRAKEWSAQLEAARNHWIEPGGLETCVKTYLARRLDKEQQVLLGDKALKTLRLSQEARALLLEDFRALGRVLDPASRAWERWVKGSGPTLAVTFEQECASENPSAALLSVGHPLIRQAVRYLHEAEAVFTALRVQSRELPSGRHSFAIYRWSRRGVRQGEELVPIAEDAVVTAKLLEALREASSADGLEQPGKETFDRLDAYHYKAWTAAAAAHREENELLVNVRMQSLTASNNARMALLESQIAAASNDKIRLMKAAERDRAQVDFERRMAELRRATKSADIQATPAVFGVLEVIGG